MGKITAKAAIGTAVLCALTALPALAADLTLKVNSSTHSVAITNNLSSKVTMLFLKSVDDMNLPVYAQLDKGATVNVPLRFEMPATVGQAVCDVSGQRRFLTVELK